jgi:hypothetical protein
MAMGSSDLSSPRVVRPTHPAGVSAEGRPDSGAPVNHLGWQGWRIDLPADWNPARLVGTDRRGSMIVADLEGPRLEMSWKTVRSARAVDLSRLTRRSRRERFVWAELTADHLGEGIVGGYRTTGDDGAVITMLLSGVSRRLAWFKVLPARRGGPGGDYQRDILLADAGGRTTVPWCIYGFAWAVPKGFRLVDQAFTPGHIRVEFRHRRRQLVFERWAVTGERAETPAAAPPADTSVLSHNGHEVCATASRPARLWDRLWRRSASLAEWVCPDARRRYRISASACCSPRALEEAVRSVICH